MSNDVEASSDFTAKQNRRVSNWECEAFGKLKNKMEHSIQKGQSFAANPNLPTLMNHKDYSIVVGLQVSNWTKYSLEDPRISHFSGYVSTAATPVLPGKQEALIAHKNPFTPSGSSGMVSWLVHKTKRRLFVVWSSPFIGSNKLAVGFTADGTFEHEEKWYRTIIKQENNGSIVYVLQEYKNSSREIVVTDKTDQFEVKGSMGTSSKPEIDIVFRPKDIADLSIRN